MIVNSGVAVLSFTVLDEAYVSPQTSSDSPRWLLGLLLGVAVGLGAAFALAFFVEYWRDPIRSPRDLLRHGVDVLGVVPRVP